MARFDRQFDVVTTLNGNPTFSEGGSAVVIDADVEIFDRELSGIDDFNGTTITLQRSGGANANDQFGYLSTPATDAATIVNTGGQLSITFTTTVTNTELNTVLQSLSYANVSDAPPSSVDIEWTFNDGNAGAQGGGGALTAVGTTTVDITVVNDQPQITVPAGTLMADEGVPLNLHGVGFSVSDLDAGAGTLIATLTVAGGTITVAEGDSGVTVVNGNGTGTVLLTGTQSAINNLLSGSGTGTIQYLSATGPSASTTFTLTVNDGGNTGSDPGTSGDASSEEGTGNTVISINSAPTISGLSGDVLAYTAGDGQVQIEQGANAVVSDSDSANFDTGTLTVSITSGNIPLEDALSIRHQGTGPGQIGVSGNTVSFAGTTFATFTGGTSGLDLVFTFDSDATPLAVTQLVQNITYENSFPSPTTGSRGITFVVSDGDGATSVEYHTTVSVNTVASATILDNFSQASYSNNHGTENWLAPWQEIGESDGATAGVVEANGYSLEFGGTSALGLSIDGLGLRRSADLSNATSASLSVDFWRTNETQNASLTLSASSDGTSWTDLHTFNGGLFSSSRATHTFNILPFASATTFVRLVGDGFVNGELIGGNFLYADTVAIDFVRNLSPQIANLNGDTLNYSEGDADVIIDQNVAAVITDADSSDFDAGSLTISFASGNVPTEDRLAVRNTGTGTGQIEVNAGVVTYEGVTIGSRTSDGTNGNDLAFSFNTNATQQALTALVRQITYENTNTTSPDTSSRGVDFVLTDGDGGVSLTHSATLNIAPVNDAPVITVVGSSGGTAGEGSGAASFGNDTLTDVDSADFDGGTLTITVTSTPDPANYSLGDLQHRRCDRFRAGCFRGRCPRRKRWRNDGNHRSAGHHLQCEFDGGRCSGRVQRVRHLQYR